MTTDSFELLTQSNQTHNGKNGSRFYGAVLRRNFIFNDETLFCGV